MDIYLKKIFKIDKLFKLFDKTIFMIFLNDKFLIK